MKRFQAAESLLTIIEDVQTLEGTYTNSWGVAFSELEPRKWVLGRGPNRRMALKVAVTKVTWFQLQPRKR
jgi:hypothetical protein